MFIFSPLWLTACAPVAESASPIAAASAVHRALPPRLIASICSSLL